MNLDSDLLRFGAAATVLVYFAFDFIDSRRVQDEREELIRLRSLELVNKVTVTTAAALALAYLFFPSMPALIPIQAVILASLYTEILGKLYFRRKL